MMEEKIKNQYATYYKRQPDNELAEIAFNKEMYHDEARMAALSELKSRNVNLSEVQDAELNKLINNAKAVEVKKQEVIEDAKNKVNAEIPEYYSPMVILGLSVLFSVIFGGFLMFLNLRKAGKKSESIIALIISFVISAISGLVFHTNNGNLLIASLINLSGGLVLIEYFWKFHIGYQVKFVKKSFIKEVLIYIGVAFLLFFVSLYFFPKQFPQIK